MTFVDYGNSPKICIKIEDENELDWKDRLIQIRNVYNETGDFAFKEFLEICREMSLDKEWMEYDATKFADHIAHVHAEVSEAYEDFREGREFNETYYKDGKIKGIPVEFADVIIKTIAVCSVFEIDIVWALIEKLNYNAVKRKKKSEKDRV